MPNLVQNLAVVIAARVAPTGFMAGPDRVWPIKKRHSGNVRIGWQLGLPGTADAATLGFMLGR